MNSTVPIIILNWNGLEDTVACVESLARQSFQDYHVFLVDNGSDESNTTALKENYQDCEKISLIFNQQNLGFTHAHIAVVEEIIRDNQYKYIALLNNDTKVEPCWLAALVRCAEETTADMVASKMVRMDEPEIIDNIGHYMLNTGEILPLGNGESASSYGQRLEVFGPCAGAALYTSRLIRDVGFFDPFFNTGYEDAEFGARAVVLGYKCIYEPEAIVHHKGSASINKVRDYDYAVRLVVNIYYTHLKLTPLSILLLNIPFVLIKFLLVICLPMIIGRARISKTHLDAISAIVGENRAAILSSRSSFFRNYSPSIRRVFVNQKFFLLTYVKYSRKYLVERRKTVFE